MMRARARVCVCVLCAAQGNAMCHSRSDGERNVLTNDSLSTTLVWHSNSLPSA
jgi:hypothetical protein